MKLLEQFRQHQWDRLTLAGALFPVVFVVLAIAAVFVLDWLHSSHFRIPAWAMIAGLLVLAQSAFSTLAWFGLANRLSRCFSRHVLIQIICVPVTGVWFLCFYVFAWLTLSGW